ncbi:MAG: hypothetical protein JWM44_4190 [Bacilli bacterium]|nr:hypothetical protein [Bacilli bacterium]
MTLSTAIKPEVYREYEISYPGFFNEGSVHKETLMATSGPAARYECFLNYSDACPDMTFFEFLQRTRIRSLNKMVADSVIYPHVHVERIEIVNRIIHEIGSRGRKFTWSTKHNRFCNFYFEKKRLWYIDVYYDVPLHMIKDQKHQSRQHEKYFSGGGTMWGLMNDFKDFIYGDDDANHNNGYGGLYCQHWGYPEEDMEAIRKLAVELGYLNE